ncbi:glycoside hydrolase family 61 protein [Geosmithia morbida]|uniref:lytic cellulose monooxygenase (C4-dehydrogenating) n=1 Tax=Geosmithia morbida TaxID=1094350 RepID=A0A9P5D342_9HYPO|nr:glycoside hydrolase family 61 protein [Geosmithia morbida]KAF4121430.1 glycoside hydrolase family 61 protein [Geosmithia morbida]
MSSTTRTLATALFGAATVAAHGYVSNIVINGVNYPGYDVTKIPYMSESEKPDLIAWSSGATDLGFVAPDAYTSGDIICHKNSTNAAGFAEVAAGDSIFLQWNTWPESHKGPVIDYLASCEGDCSTVDKASLKFFKIDQVGLVDGTSVPGIYGSDELLDNSNGWLVQIPADVAPGNYVLRHELIALHSAGTEGGAQNYPQCFSLKVTGSGSESPAGTLGTELYTSTEDGIVFNIYQSVASYPVPGPTVIAGASAVAQSTSAIQSTGAATVGAAAVETSPAAVATSAAASSAAATTEAATSEATSVQAVASETAAATTTAAAAEPTSTKTSCRKKRAARALRARSVKA